jgi:hypothetical protein
MFQVTDVFKQPLDPDIEWSQETADLIKQRYQSWFDAWVRQHLAILAKSQKDKVADKQKKFEQK